MSEDIIGSGSGETSSPNYTVLSTYGQPVGGIEMQSSSYSVSSGFVTAARPAIKATINIDPNTLNLRSEVRWIICFITLPEGYPKDVFDPTAVALTRVNGKTLDTFVFSDLEAIPPKSTNNRYNESDNYPEDKYKY